MSGTVRYRQVKFGVAISGVEQAGNVTLPRSRRVGSVRLGEDQLDIRLNSLAPVFVWDSRVAVIHHISNVLNRYFGELLFPDGHESVGFAVAGDGEVAHVLVR